MRNIQTTKGGLGVFALAFAASLLLLMPGCQGPLGTERAAPETGTVRLALEMPPVGRAILPTITLDDFDYFRLAFTSGPDTHTARWDGTDGTINLAAGDWYLIVTAYLTGYDFYAYDYLLYSGPAIPVNVAPGAVSDVDVSLSPVLLPGDGTFIWNVTVPAGTATLTVRNLNNIVVGTASVVSGVEGDMQLPAGRYNVLIRVVNGTQVAVLGKPLFVLPYREMPSRLDHEFEAGHFRALASDTLGGFIARTGDWWDANTQPDWVNTPITEGAFTSGAELNDSGLPLEWVDNDGALSLRVAGRTENHHGVDLMTAGLGLQVGDRIYVTGRVVAGAVAAGGRAMFANADPDGHAQLAQGTTLGNTALDYVPLGLSGFPLLGSVPAVVRIQTNGWSGQPAGTVAHGIHTFYIDGITIYRTYVPPVSGTLGGFINLVGMPARAWQSDTITAGTGMSTVGGQPLTDSGDLTLSWENVDGSIVLRMTDRLNDWDGLDIRTGAAYNLGFSANGVYQIIVTGTMAVGTPRIQTIPSFGGIGAVTWVERAFTITSPNILAANLPGTAFRVNSTTVNAGGVPGNIDGNIDITGITITRVGELCPNCGEFPSVCCYDCGLPPADCECDVFDDGLAGAPALINRAPLGALRFDLQTALADLAVGAAPAHVVGHNTVTATVQTGPRPAQQRFVLTGSHTAGNTNGVMIDFDTIPGVIPGDTVHIRGRVATTHAGGGGGRIALFETGSTLDAGILDESGFGAAPSVFEFTRLLTPSNVSQNLIIQANFWGGAGQANFSFSVDDLVIVEATPATRLQVAVAAANAVLAGFTATNDVTGPALLAEVQAAIDSAITASWSATAPFTLTPSVGETDGSITGTIVLTIDGVTADVAVNLTIPGAVDGYVFNMQEFETQAAALAHFLGAGNRGIVSVTGTPGDWTATFDRMGQGPGDGGYNNPIAWNWNPMTILRPGQGAAGDTLRVTGSLGGAGIIPLSGTTIGLALGVEGAGNAPLSGARIDDGSNNLAAPGTFSIEFELTPEAVAQGLSVRWNSWGTIGEAPPGDPALTANHQAFTINIYTVTVERDTPSGSANVGNAGLNISFDELRNRIDPIQHTVPLGGVVGSTIAAPPGFSGHSWSRNLAVIGSGSTLTLDASFQRAGRHLVTLRADFNGRMYSQIVEVVVTT